MSEDRLIQETEQAEQEAWQGDDIERAANLFDLRRIIGALFVLYGIVLIIVGLGDSDAEIRKAAGVHINLWAGLGMLVLGLLFVAWALLRPLSEQLDDMTEEEQPAASRGA
jgi:hypothetical protein